MPRANAPTGRNHRLARRHYPGCIWRYLWSFPTTLLGLAVALLTLATGGTVVRHTGILEVHGGFASSLLRRVGALAMTLGHVVLARDRAAHDASRTHERVHVAQCERWGPLFLPVYGIASLLAWWRGGHYYFDNAFEREAYATS
jgi:hypothetical protein